MIDVAMWAMKNKNPQVLLNKQPPYAYDKDLMSEMIKQHTLMNNSINSLMGFHA